MAKHACIRAVLLLEDPDFTLDIKRCSKNSLLYKPKQNCAEMTVRHLQIDPPKIKTSVCLSIPETATLPQPMA